MSVTFVPFGTTKDGRQVEKVLLKNGSLEAEIMTLGATVLSLRVPDRDGKKVDVVLGYSCVRAYEKNEGYLGALVGRYANRIAGARFFIDGTEYRLAANEGGKQLHGGPEGFSRQIFSAEAMGGSAVAFSYTAPDGENGYPGTLQLKATYTLTERGLVLRYEAVCDKDTFCNITNHSYFNLNGCGDILSHSLWIDGEHITPVDADSLPVAKKLAVAGTPFDFRTEKCVGQDIDADHEQLRFAGGYDHNFILRKKEGLRLAARLRGEGTGIAMEVWTDQPGVQLYSGNFLSTTADTKTGVPYQSRAGLCLETQLPPDSPNHPEWGETVLKKGQWYCRTTEYRFV